jgi:hypothetical protein
MQRQYDDVAQPAAGAFATNVSSVPEPWNLCGDVFANVNIASPELTAHAFGELHDLQTPLMYASKNCEQPAALARIEKAALAAASASKAADTSAALRRRDQRLCKGCSVRAGADRRTLCHTRDSPDGSVVGCPHAAQAATYPAGGYK